MLFKINFTHRIWFIKASSLFLSTHLLNPNIFNLPELINWVEFTFPWRFRRSGFYHVKKILIIIMQVFFIKRLKVEKKMLNRYLLNVVSSTNPSKFSCCKYCAKFAIVSCSLRSLTLKPASFRALKKRNSTYGTF